MLSLFLVAILALSLSAPALAASNFADETSLSEAYISFSEQLNDVGISATTCLEDFIGGYEQANTTLQTYIKDLIGFEMAAAATNEAMVAYNEEHTIEYIVDGIEPYSVGSQWYDNIGTSSPQLPCAASYSKHNILSTVSKGDIVEETSGGIASVTGHIAIVQGKYWDSTYKQYYIRTVEAGIDGVVYGVLDDDRYDFRGVNVYYVSSATSTQKSNAVTFCVNQLGKNYALDIPVMTSCNYKSDTTNWYCSELVWAAYYNQNINLNGTTIPMNIYMPATLASSSKLTSRAIS